MKNSSNNLSGSTTMTIVLFAIIILTIGMPACMSTETHSVNQDEYLGNLNNSLNIYLDDQCDKYYMPFDINIRPMEKLMLVDFESDFEYETIELQTYNDSRGKGATVILYGKNGKNDLYYTDKKFADTSLFDKDQLCESNDIKYALDISEKGLKSFLKMNDKEGKFIEVEIEENRQKNDPTSLLAPIGGVIENFTYFPFFYMHDFNFAKRANTEISVRIDGINCKPKKIPILLNGSFVYLCRYSSSPIIAQINRNTNGSMAFVDNIKIPITKNVKRDYYFINNQKHKELEKIVCSSSNGNVGISFSPAIPNITDLKADQEIMGKFSFESENITGIVAGEYKIETYLDKVILTMQPTEAYSPMTGPLWVKQYKWHAEVIKDKSNGVRMNSNWVISKQD